MKVLFVGLLYNPERESEYLSHSKVGISVASNLYQWNVIRGIRANGVDIEAVGSIPYGNYPQLADVKYVEDKNFTVDGIKLTQLGFINYYGVKHKIRECKIKSYIKRWAEKNREEHCAIIFYDLQTPFLHTINWVKKYNSIRTCLIVPDLAGKLRNDCGVRGIKEWIINYSAESLLRKAYNADSYLLLTEQMNAVINPNNYPYIVVDGVVDDEKTVDIVVPKKRVIMYAGNISEQYAITGLLNHFRENRSDNLELWFCGKGNAENAVIEASKCDSRVKYLGFVSKAELSEIEKNVCFYINPRTNNGEYTKYSFPSKNLEYLLAGKPVIAYKLNGMSDDYDDIFIYLSEQDESSIDEMFKIAANMEDEEIALLARQGLSFVKEHNGKMIQGKKIFKLLEGLFDED